jgi:hypothetical protein
MVHRGLATVAMALGFCFLLLSHFDSQFFLIHFYESLVYLAIVLMLFYFEDRWAYMMGIVAPVVWLALSVAWGGVLGFWHQMSMAFHPGNAFFSIGLVTILTLLLSIALVAGCAVRWHREFTGLHKGWSTLLVTAIVAVIYYGILVVWILRWPPLAS